MPMPWLLRWPDLERSTGRDQDTLQLGSFEDTSRSHSSARRDPMMTLSARAPMSDFLMIARSGSINDQPLCREQVDNTAEKDIP
jgi:hypothetical protein